MEEKIIKKSEKLFLKGENQLEKGNIEKAIKYFKESKELNPTLDNLSKLIDSHHQIESQWTEEDFINNLSWTMERQELQDPHMKRVHARFDPKWKEVQNLISRLFQSPEEEVEKLIIQEIVSFERDALYPLIETIIKLRDQLVSMTEFDPNQINTDIDISEEDAIEAFQQIDFDTPEKE